MEKIVRLTSLAKDHHLIARILARVMRAVLSGDKQAIAVKPTEEDIRAAQALLQLAARVDPKHGFQGRRAPSLILSTDKSPTTAPYPGSKSAEATTRRRTRSQVLIATKIFTA